MFLENEIIKLRPVEPEDAETMWIVESDSEQWMQNGMSAPLSRQNLTDYALSYDADPVRAGQLRLIIESKPEKGIIGIADLYDISVQHRLLSLPAGVRVSCIYKNWLCLLPL